MTRLVEDVWRWGYAMLRCALLDAPSTTLAITHLDDLRAADRLAAGGQGVGSLSGDALQVPAVDWHHAQPLQSLFPQVFPRARLSQPEAWLIPPTPLLSGAIPYPVAAEKPGAAPALTAAVERARTALRTDLDLLRQGDPHHADEVAPPLMRLLLEKYGTTLPLPAGEDVYTSLYDHLKLTAALGACRLASPVLTPACYLVMGDLSGIQDFVFGISARGALKGLRARSFFLEMLLVHTVELLLEGTGMGQDNVLYVGGGNFALLLPPLDSTPALLEQIHTRVNGWLLQEFDGQRFLGMLGVPVPPEALQGQGQETTRTFDTLWQQAMALLDADKRRRFASQLAVFTPEGANALFGPFEPQQRADLDECQICACDDAPKSAMMPLFKDEAGEEDEAGERVCINCYRFFHLGDQLTAVCYIARCPGAPTAPRQVCLELPGPGATVYTYTLTTGPETLPPAADRVWVVNSFDVTAYQSLSTRFTHVYPLLVEHALVTYGDLLALDGDPAYTGAYERARNIERDNLQERLQGQQRDLRESDIRHNVVSFAGLAATACGAKLIGALRMDVDHLGLLLSQGLPDPQRRLSHLAVVSRQLSTFFKGYLNWICAGDRARIALPSDGAWPDLPLNLSQRLPTAPQDRPAQRMLSLIYAGGDDLFLVGAWSDVVEVSYDIAHCFYAYTGQQRKFVTLSAGLTVHHPAFPLAQMAQRSLVALQRAKASREVPAQRCFAEQLCVQTTRCPLYQAQGDICHEKGAVALLYSDVVETRAQQLQARYASTDEPERIVNVLTWHNSLALTVDVAQQLARLGTLEDGALRLSVPRGFLRRLLAASRRWHTDGMLYIPFLEWAYSRTAAALTGEFTTETQREAWEWVQGTFLPQLTSVAGLRGAGAPRPALIKSVHIPLSWVELLLRRQETRDE